MPELRASTMRLREGRQAGEEGFALVELVIAIVIFGVLAAIVLSATGGRSTGSKTAACNAEKQSVVLAEGAYYASANHAKGHNATYGTPSELRTNGRAVALLDNVPSRHWGISDVTATGYTVTGLAGSDCAGMTFTLAVTP